MSVPIVVVHDVGADGGAWRDALREWDGDVFAPDLVLEKASGDRTDVVWLLLEQLEAWREQQPVIIGCGEHSMVADTFALAGWVGRLVLVDGLGGAWTTPAEQVAAQNAWLRAKHADPDLVGYPKVWNRDHLGVLRAHAACPALLIETPASITPPGEAERRAAQWGAGAQVVRLAAAAPSVVVPVVQEWVGS